MAVQSCRKPEGAACAGRADDARVAAISSARRRVIASPRPVPVPSRGRVVCLLEGTEQAGLGFTVDPRPGVRDFETDKCAPFIDLKAKMRSMICPCSNELGGRCSRN